MRCCECLRSCRGLFTAFVNAAHTLVNTEAFREQLLLMGPRCGAWELDASLCVFANPWEMALGWVQFVCILQSSSPGANQPSPLIRAFNAIMVVGTAKCSSLAPPQLLTLQAQVFQGEIHLSLIKIHLFFTFLFRLIVYHLFLARLCFLFSL